MLIFVVLRRVEPNLSELAGKSILQPRPIIIPNRMDIWLSSFEVLLSLMGDGLTNQAGYKCACIELEQLNVSGKQICHVYEAEAY
jgi:hypothetical protein